jgi:hypothetical protein
LRIAAGPVDVDGIRIVPRPIGEKMQRRLPRLVEELRNQLG